MLRTVGLCVIVISGIGCGFAMSNELGRRKKMMEMILRMIILLRGEIRYGNKSLYDAFTGASGKLEGKYREFFILTAQKMKEKTGDSFGTIFRESAGKCLDLDCLSQEERDRFYSLGDQLGYLGLDMQLKQMDLMEKETEYAIRELRKDFCVKKKIITAVWEYWAEYLWLCFFGVACIYNLFLYCVDYCFAISGSRSRKGETVEVSLIFKIRCSRDSGFCSLPDPKTQWKG